MKCHILTFLTLSRPSLTSRLKLQADLSIILLLSDVCHVAHDVTLSPILNSPVSDISTSLFHKKMNTHLFQCYFRS